MKKKNIIEARHDQTRENRREVRCPKCRLLLCRVSNDFLGVASFKCRRCKEESSHTIRRPTHEQKGSPMNAIEQNIRAGLTPEALTLVEDMLSGLFFTFAEEIRMRGCRVPPECILATAQLFLLRAHRDLILAAHGADGPEN